MKLLRYLFCILSVVGIFLSSSVNADWWDGDKPRVIIKTGTITDYGNKMGHERGEHLAYLELDGTTLWEMDFDAVPELNWEIGDNIKIYIESGAHLHTAENINKHNHAFLKLLKL